MRSCAVRDSRAEPAGRLFGVRRERRSDSMTQSTAVQSASAFKLQSSPMRISRPASARLRKSAISICLLVLAAATACEDDTPSTAPPQGGQSGTAISIAIAPGAATIAVGGTQSMAASVSGTTNTVINWSTSASSVAAISSSGVVTGVAPGTAIITAAAAADPSRIATATISVTAPLTLRVPVDTVRPGTALRAIVTGITLPTTLPATLGTSAITLARETDSTLVGFVPDMASGITTLRVTIGTRSGQVVVDVRPGLVIADPTFEITRLADRVRQRYSSTTVPAGYTTAEWTRSRAVVDSLDRELRVALAAAPAAERLATARMLAAYTTSAVSAIFVTPDRCGGAADRILAKSVNVIGNLLDIRAAEVLTTKLRNLVGMTNHLDGVLDYIVSMATFPVDCAVTEILENDAPAGNTVDHGGTLGIVVTAVIRSLDGSQSQDPTIQRVTNTIDRLFATFRTLPQVIQSVLGKLPTRVQDLPVQPPTRAQLEPQYVREGSVTPASVSVSVRADGNRVALVATTTATEPTAFTVVLRHVNDATVTTTVRGTVRPAANITVVPSTTSLTIVGPQTERTVSATITGATNSSLQWQIGNMNIATIASSSSGVAAGASVTLRAQNPGTTTLTVRSIQDPTKSATIAVTVTSGIGITVNPPSGTLAVGQTLPLTATLTGTNSTGVIWRSGAESVATVDVTGLVTARAVGTAVITATAAYDFDAVARATITVSASSIAISLNPTNATIAVGGTQFLAVNLTGVPAGQSTSANWTSSNSSAVSVAAGNGGLTITGLAPGTSTITVRPVADPTKAATATITVTSGSTGTPGATRLTGGVAVSGLAGAVGSAKLYVITVPTGATNLTVRTSGGTGDADLYVRRGSPPTSSVADCASDEVTTVESCTFTNPAAGEWYILLVGYGAYSGVTLTATVTGGTGGGGTGGGGSGNLNSDAACAAYWRPILTAKSTWAMTRFAEQGVVYGYMTSEHRQTLSVGTSTLTMMMRNTSGYWYEATNAAYAITYNVASPAVAPCLLEVRDSRGYLLKTALRSYSGGTLLTGWTNSAENGFYVEHTWQ